MTYKRTSSGDKGFLSHLANSNCFDYLESFPELTEMLSFNASKYHFRMKEQKHLDSYLAFLNIGLLSLRLSENSVFRGMTELRLGPFLRDAAHI